MSLYDKEEAYHLLPPADLVAEIERLHDELRKEQERHLRTLADLKNFRRRIERDGNTIADESKKEMCRAILSIVDDLEKALGWTSYGEQALVKGVEGIHQKLIAMLERYNVRPFDAVGKPFTTDLHEAVAVTERAHVAPGTVVEVVRKGYLWTDEVLRPAQVQVAE
jgi:molecular chaperone GrpE